MTVMLIALGAAIAYLGVILGIVRERSRQPKPTPPPQPICGCEHELAMHDPESSRCHERVYLGMGNHGPCKCRQYVGPRPIDQVFLP